MYQLPIVQAAKIAQDVTQHVLGAEHGGALDCKGIIIELNHVLLLRIVIHMVLQTFGIHVRLSKLTFPPFS